MLKATLHSAAVLAMLVTSMPAFAEVQNVRVGGDVTARAFWRSNLDLHNDDTGTGDVLDQEDNFLMSTIGLNVGADLTENVSAFLRLANERDWNVDATTGSTADLAVSQGYVTLKELFYSPLTLRVGKQPIVWGRGFVLGSSLIPDTLNRGGQDLHAAIAANEFTDFTSFDAIRATLDLSGAAAVDLPLTVDYVYIKLDENNIGLADDVTLQGVNLSTQFDNGEAELYFLNKRDKAAITGFGNVSNPDGSVNTLGLRGSLQPAEGSTVWAEGAYQFGKRATDPNGDFIRGDAISAWAFNLGAEVSLGDEMAPKIGAEYIFFSGEDSNGAAGGWDPIARGYFTTLIREFQNTGFYVPDQTCYLESGTAAGAPGGEACTGSATNQHQVSIFGSFVPLEDLTVAQRVSLFWAHVGLIPDGGAAAGGTRMAKRQNYAGTEWDTMVTYDYTDDVELGLIYGVFWPGEVYHSPNTHTAQELITSVSVKF